LEKRKENYWRRNKKKKRKEEEKELKKLKSRWKYIIGREKRKFGKKIILRMKNRGNILRNYWTALDVDENKVQ